MNISEANRLLGGPHSTQEAITAAYRAAVRAAHPDTAVDPGAGIPLSALQAARETLTKALVNGLNHGQEIACRMCGGSGRIGAGFGKECIVCKGTGHQHG